jgi:hypothetical protein
MWRSRYVCNEIAHHIEVASTSGTGYDEATLKKWLLDLPPDCITWAAAKLVGTDRLRVLGEQANSGGEYWMAAVYLALGKCH